MEIETKYSVGDVVQLLNGKFRKITNVDVSVYDYISIVRYQGKWYTPLFFERDVALKVSGKKEE